MCVHIPGFLVYNDKRMWVFHKVDHFILKAMPVLVSVGFVGKTSLEQAKTDMIVECVDDMMVSIMPAYREKNEQKRVS